MILFLQKMFFVDQNVGTADDGNDEDDNDDHDDNDDDDDHDDNNDDDNDDDHDDGGVDGSNFRANLIRGFSTGDS